MFKIFSLKKILNDNTREANSLNDEQLKDLQGCLLKCLSEIIEVCKENNIKPFLVGGSLLGYVRHKGFIPWDDDLDIALFRKDYEKLIKIFDETLSDRYIMSAPKKGCISYNRFLQLYRKGTVLKGQNVSRRAPDMIYIDIFPIDYVPDNTVIRICKGLYCNMLMMIAGFTDTYCNMTDSLRQTMRLSRNGRILYRIRMIIGKLFSWRKPKDWFVKVDQAIQWHHKSGKVAPAPGRKHYFGEIVPTNVMRPLKPIDFLGVPMYIPNKPEVYLENLFGDYMSIPPVEERESHFASEIKVL